MQAYRNYIFFKLDKEYEDKLVLQSGLELELVPGGEPGRKLHHVREFGTVVSAPLFLSPELRTTMDVLPGDKIYFHFHTVSEENRYEIDGEILYKVHYSEVYCAIRKGEIIMLNDYIFCEPVMETEEDIKTPAGLYKKAFPEPIKFRAKVVKIKKSLSEIPGVLKEGDDIYYDTHSDIPLKVEGKEYYRMRERDVIAKYA